MFGYVTPCKDELKIKDYNVFRAYYCGLCRAVGAHCQAARLALSYDMTFLSVLLSSVSDAPVRAEKRRCIAHPVNRRESVTDDEAVEYGARMSILLTYLKLRDDLADDKSVRALAGMAVYGRAARRIKKLYPELSEKIISSLDRLSRLEKERCASIDMTADCFAGILSELFTPPFIEEEPTRRALSWLGYNIGRWIYIIDAYCDIDKDKKRKSYNPFLCAGREDKDALGAELDETLTYTLGSAASAYELLSVYKNDAILRNILYLGLKNKQDTILKGSADKTDEPI